MLRRRVHTTPTDPAAIPRCMGVGMTCTVEGRDSGQGKTQRTQQAIQSAMTHDTLSLIQAQVGWRVHGSAANVQDRRVGTRHTSDLWEVAYTKTNNTYHQKITMKKKMTLNTSTTRVTPRSEGNISNKATADSAFPKG
ncbi:hypothetical protein ONZ45_g14221 [Pleurotus djamor]|nr:hypothetical protein ONZ45_g14221 [Pleurotus djamor]